jgi:sugar lactone lactonase YvrE
MFQTVGPLFSPTQDSDGNLFAVSTNGDVYQVTEQGQMETAFSTGGQPTGLVFDSQGSSFIADLSHQAVLSQTVTDNRIEIIPVIKDFDGSALKGPNSMVLSEKNNSLFFTDSGPMGESSLESATGSLFVIDLGVSMLKPILFGCLAHPSGLVMNSAQNILYVAETLKNRILRVLVHTSGIYHTSVFHQFSGRLGPTALAMNARGQLFVARFDYQEATKHGLITVLNEEGEVLDDLCVNDCPELTGLWFSNIQNKKDTLYATESSTNSFLQINTTKEE